ncbi:MAG: hypothetical protein JWN59_1248, partial [Sphingomonas bacterium]|nr:hypothetical protein [Sphingomonas bacterium]
MRRALALLLTAAIPLSTVPAPAQTHAHADPAAGAAFAALGKAYLDGLARFSPVYATQLGDHRSDADLDDRSEGARGRALAFAKTMLEDLGRIDRAALSPTDQVDAALLDNALRYDVWRTEKLQDWAWDPQLYNETAGSALYGLAARDFAPWSVRMRAATARMEKLPALLAQTRASLVPARVPRIHAETVARQNGGLIEVVD